MTAQYTAPVLTEPQLRALANAVDGRADLLSLQAADTARSGPDRRRLHAERRALLAAEEQLRVAARAFDPAPADPAPPQEGHADG